MGLVKKPKYTNYWSTDSLMDTPIFRTACNRQHYLNILKFWHFNDNDQQPNPQDPNHDHMYKIRPVIDHLNRKFQAAIQAEQEVALDESLLLYKGHLAIKQFLPAKRSRFGIKIFQLCESKSGFTYKFMIYPGRLAPVQDIMNQMPNVEGATSTDKLSSYMLEPLLGCGYHLYVDNWYSNLRLFRYLQSQNTAACGTIRKNRLPQEVSHLDVGTGETKSLLNDDLLVVRYSPRVNKYVHMLMTIHNEQTRHVNVRGRHHTRAQKPVCVIITTLTWEEWTKLTSFFSLTMPQGRCWNGIAKLHSTWCKLPCWMPGFCMWNLLAQIPLSSSSNWMFVETWYSRVMWIRILVMQTWWDWRSGTLHNQ